MKRYNSTDNNPRHYTDKRHFVFNRRKSKVPSPNEIFSEDDDISFSTCSVYDCTGMIPSAIQNEGQADAYEEIYQYIAPPAPPKNE